MKENEFTWMHTDSDKRMLDDYNYIKKKVMKIKAKKINSIKNEVKKGEAIRILQDIYNYLNQQLVYLDEIEIIDADFEIKKRLIK